MSLNARGQCVAASRKVTPRASEETENVRFPAMRHRNFRLFWTGNLISLIGTMAQQTALGWLVRDLTKSPFLLTLVAACGSIPILLLTLPAGVIADRVDKRRALILTNSLAAICSLILAAMVHFGVAQVWNIALMALLVGGINAFDIPVRQSFNVEMVGRDDLPNAIAFNSSAFNGARVFGPMVGGVLLRNLGVAGCLFVNTLSFFALILGLSLMRLSALVSTQQGENNGEPLRQALLTGWNYVRRDAIIWPVMGLVAWVSVWGMSFSALLPIFARDVFRTDSAGYAHLMTFNGLGAMGAAVTLALHGKMEHKGKRLLLGAALFSVCVLGFALSPNLYVSFAWLVGAGWFLLTFLMTANTLVQTTSPDELRGRIFSLYSLALIGTAPLGVLLIGALAQVLGAQVAVTGSALVSLMFVMWLYVSCRALWKTK